MAGLGAATGAAPIGGRARPEANDDGSALDGSDALGCNIEIKTGVSCPVQETNSRTTIRSGLDVPG